MLLKDIFIKQMDNLLEDMKRKLAEPISKSRWKTIIQRKLGTEAPLIFICQGYTSSDGRPYTRIEINYTQSKFEYLVVYDTFVEHYKDYLRNHGFIISRFNEGFANYVCFNLNKREEIYPLCYFPFHFGNIVFENKTEMDEWFKNVI